MVAAIRKIEHGVSFVPRRGAVFRGRNMDTNIVIKFLLICDVLKEILRAFLRGLYSAELHPKQRALYAVITRILQSLAGKKQTPSTSRPDLRPVHRRSYSTAAILRYTQFK